MKKSIFSPIKKSSQDSTVKMHNHKTAEKHEETTQTALEQQLRIFDTALSNTQDFYYILDLDHTFIYVNKPLLTLWGKSMEDVYGKNFQDLGYSPELVKLHKGQLQQVIQTKKIVKGENAYTNSEGNSGYYEYTFVPVFGENGEVEAISGSTHDITERKSIAELKLKASEDKYRIVFNSIDEGFCVIEMLFDNKDKPVDWLYLEVNKSFEKQTGLKNAVGKRVLELIPDHEAYWFDIYGKVALTGASIRFENRAEALNRWFDLYAFRIGEPEERKVAILFNNTTKRREAEEQSKALSLQIADTLEFMGDGFFIIDKDWNLAWVNRVHEKITKTAREKTLGKNFWKTFPGTEDPNSNYWIEYNKVMETRKPSHFVKYYEPLDLWTDVDVYPTREGGISVFFRDITNRKRTEEALRESEDRFRTIANNISQLTWMTDADGWIFWYNERWFEYTGTTLKEMEGWGWKKVHHPEHVERVVEKFSHHIKTGETWEDTFPLRDKNGEFRWFLSRAIPIRDNKGKILHWFGTNTDITELRELERQKDDFIGIASHELKTPVTSIKAYTQVLQSRLLKEGNTKLAEHLGKMDGQLDKLTSLISDLLDSTKIEAGKLQFQKDYLDFNELVIEIVDEIQRTTERHQIVKALTKSKVICGDRDRIGQVITNLLTNAIKYSPHAEEIIVTTKVDTNNVTLSVQDFGIGISKEKQEKVFERFYRVEEREHQETYAGLGLGLYISAEIIKRQGGRIWVEGKEGGGSTFFFSLPLKERKI